MFGFAGRCALGQAPSAPCTVTTTSPSKSDRGTVTVGCPKVWRSERVLTVLDGLLRDVDSITVKALEVDANATNATEIESLITELQVNAKFDQAAAVNSALNLQKIQLQRGAEVENFQSQQQANQILIQRRTILEKELLDLQQKEADAVKADPKNPALDNIHAQQGVAKQQITDIDAALAKPAIADQTVAGTSATAPPDAKPITPLATLPADFAKSLQDSLKAPSLPATMRMDNVIELLHERLSRELAVMYDDVSRQSGKYDVYLVQFDIGVLPGVNASDRNLQVKVAFKENVTAYELYPSASSYNIMHTMDKTSRLGISGAAQTLFGFGLSAAFNREHDQMHSGLSQSLYVSGFGAGSQSFGWLIGSAPFENVIAPGTRTVHALIMVPKGTKRVTAEVSHCWPSRQARYHWFGSSSDDGCDKGAPGVISLDLPNQQVPLTIRRVSYVPRLAAPNVKPEDPDALKQTNTVQLTFGEPIDPNLTITAGDRIISRVRDFRGRALYGAGTDTLAGTSNEQSAVAASRFGLLEKDKLDPDTWFQLNPRSILLNLSLATAGTDNFPVIRVAGPDGEGAELSTLIAKAPDDPTDPVVRVDEWQFKVGGWRANYGYLANEFLESAFLPLFHLPYDSGRIAVFVDSVTPGQPNQPKTIRIVSERRAGLSNPPWLHERAQVVLQPLTGPDSPTPDPLALDCDQEEGTLLCKMPKNLAGAKDQILNYKIWLDQPPYQHRPGLWADSNIPKPAESDAWKAQIYPWGGWHDISETCTSSCSSTETWSDWTASVFLHIPTQPKQPTPIQPGQPSVAPGVPKADLERHDASDSMRGWEHGGGEPPLPVAPPKSHYCIEEFQNLPEIFTKAIDALRQDRSDWAKEYRKAGETLAASKHQDEYAAITEDKNSTAKCKSDLIKVTTTPSGITLQIPFLLLSVIADNLHLKAIPQDNCDESKDFCRITLPDLHTQLLPGTVELVPLQPNTYRLTGDILTGDRLRAVDHIILEDPDSNRTAYPARAGYNNVDFTVPSKLAAGSYNVFLAIGTTTVPAQRLTNEKLEQVHINIGPGTAASPPPPAGPKKAQPDKPGVPADASAAPEKAAPSATAPIPSPPPPAK